MKKISKLLSILLAILMVMASMTLFIACSNDNGDEEDEKESKKDEKESKVKKYTLNFDGEEVELTLDGKNATLKGNSDTADEDDKAGILEEFGLDKNLDFTLAMVMVFTGTYEENEDGTIAAKFTNMQEGYEFGGKDAQQVRDGYVKYLQDMVDQAVDVDEEELKAVKAMIEAIKNGSLVDYETANGEKAPTMEAVFKLDKSAKTAVIRSTTETDPDGSKTVSEYYANGNTKSYISYYENGNKGSETLYGENGNTKSNISYYENGNKSLEQQYDANGNCTRRIDYYENGNKEYENEYYENGYIKSTIYYDESGNLESEWQYDENGNRKSIISYWENGKKQHETKYGENGNELSSVSYGENGNKESETEYYANGNIKSSVSYDANGNKEFETEYYENGNEKSYVSYNENGKKEYETENYENGNRKSTIYYYENGKKRYETQYDENGNRKSEIYYDENGNVRSKTQFDENGNPIIEFPAELKNVMPATLPDGSAYDVKYRMDMETNVDEWILTGRSAYCGNYKFEGVKGVYGQGISFGLVDEEHADATGSRRAEVTVEPEFAVNLNGVSGVLWWVDFTSTTPMEGKNGACASVTLQGNDYRSNKNGNLSVGYYYLDGQWVETKNVNACRMEIPHQFKGWIYVPATSYVRNSDKSAITGDDGNFLDFDVYNFNLYTDWYDLTDENLAIVFDEVMWVKRK